MTDVISPKFLMKLADQTRDAITSEYSDYAKELFYIQKWHESDRGYNDWENFSIVKGEFDRMDLLATLHGMSGDILLKIAVDMGVETPDFIPAVATFRNDIKSDYKTASATFEKAFRQIETHPDIAIALANSALESIIKEIIQHDAVKTKLDQTATLYDLTAMILKEFQMYPTSELPSEIRAIGSGFLKVNQHIEKLRSEKTNAHGKISADYIIDDPIYTYYIVNSVTTVGMFLKSYFKKKFKPIKPPRPLDDLPF